MVGTTQSLCMHSGQVMHLVINVVVDKLLLVALIV